MMMIVVIIVLPMRPLQSRYMTILHTGEVTKCYTHFQSLKPLRLFWLNFKSDGPHYALTVISTIGTHCNLEAFFFPLEQQPEAYHGPLILEVYRSLTMTHHRQLDSSGQIIGQSQRQHTIFTRNRYTCPRRNSNLQIQQASCRTPVVHWDRQVRSIVE